MASQTSSRLRFEIQALGENENTWGDARLNNALLCLEEGVSGFAEIGVGGSDVALTAVNHTPDAAEYRNAIIRLTAGAGVGARNIIVPAVEKQWTFDNTTAFTQTVKTASGTGATLSAGACKIIYCDGLNCTGITTGDAQDSAAAAATSAAQAAASATAAAASAAEAATVLAPANSAPGRGVSVKTASYTIVQADNGYFIACHAAAGNMVITLPAIAGIAKPFNVIVKKTDSTANTVTINRSSTDVFDNAGTSKVLSVQGQSTWLAADTATWYSMDAGGATLEATTSQVWTGTSTTAQITPNALYDSVARITSSGSGAFTPDMNTGLNFQRTLTGNSSVGAPTNGKDGQSLFMWFIQDSAGNRTLSFDAAFNWPLGIAPTASTAGNSVDYASCVLRGTVWDCTYVNGSV